MAQSNVHKSQKGGKGKAPTDQGRIHEQFVVSPVHSLSLDCVVNTLNTTTKGEKSVSWDITGPDSLNKSRFQPSAIICMAEPGIVFYKGNIIDNSNRFCIKQVGAKMALAIQILDKGVEENHDPFKIVSYNGGVTFDVAKKYVSKHFDTDEKFKTARNEFYGRGSSDSDIVSPIYAVIQQRMMLSGDEEVSFRDLVVGRSRGRVRMYPKSDRRLTTALKKEKEGIPWDERLSSPEHSDVEDDAMSTCSEVSIPADVTLNFTSDPLDAPLPSTEPPAPVEGDSSAEEANLDDLCNDSDEDCERSGLPEQLESVVLHDANSRRSSKNGGASPPIPATREKKKSHDYEKKSSDSENWVYIDDDNKLHIREFVEYIAEMCTHVLDTEHPGTTACPDTTYILSADGKIKNEVRSDAYHQYCGSLAMFNYRYEIEDEEVVDPEKAKRDRDAKDAQEQEELKAQLRKEEADRVKRENAALEKRRLENIALEKRKIEEKRIAAVKARHAALEKVRIEELQKAAALEKAQKEEKEKQEAQAIAIQETAALAKVEKDKLETAKPTAQEMDDVVAIREAIKKRLLAKNIQITN